MLKTIRIRTEGRDSLIDITGEIRRSVEEAGIHEGICTVFVPHTTAGLTINENADPDVKRDIIMELDKMVPFEDGYSHMEGNSAAHIKASLFGSSQTVIIDGGRLLLGTWQGIYLCEFDGPRTRKVLVKIQG